MLQAGFCITDLMIDEALAAAPDPWHWWWGRSLSKVVPSRSVRYRLWWRLVDAGEPRCDGGMLCALGLFRASTSVRSCRQVCTRNRCGARELGELRRRQVTRGGPEVRHPNRVSQAVASLNARR